MDKRRVLRLERCRAVRLRLSRCLGKLEGRQPVIKPFVGAECQQNPA